MAVPKRRTSRSNTRHGIKTIDQRGIEAVVANERRRRTVARYAARRAELKEEVRTARKAGLSRINLRALAHRGELPGITTSSW